MTLVCSLEKKEVGRSPDINDFKRDMRGTTSLLVYNLLLIRLKDNPSIPTSGKTLVNRVQGKP